MTPESPILAELKTLLDALCEETISAEQMARLEELVLAHPEAEQHYVRFMSFHADLIGTIAGLPERALPAESSRHTPSESSRHTPCAVAADGTRSVPTTSQSNSVTYPSTRHKEIASAERPRSRFRKVFAYIGPALPLLIVFGSVAAYQLIGWAIASNEESSSQRALDASREQLEKAQAEQQAKQIEQRKELDDLIAAERKLASEYKTALNDALKAISEKDFLVKVTGPEHIEPGAPNKWQIETLRHSGSVARPKQMEIVVKDDKDTPLFRQEYHDTVGSTTLELPASFWTKVKSGTNLFLEVSASTNDRPLLALADRIPLARPVYVTQLATDKPLYQPGEIVRFRSLTLDRSTLRPPLRDMHLRFRLRVPGDSIIPLDEGNGRLMLGLQPVIGPDKQPLRGIGVGEYQLSADAPGGEYKLELLEVDSTTNKEVLIETRKFIVNRYVPDTFEKKLEFDGKSYGPGEAVQARIEVSRTAGGPMKNARANVVATLDGKEFHAEKGQQFAIVADASGSKAVLNVRFKLPADLFSQKNAPSATLGVTILDGSDAEAIVRPIPLVTKTLSIEFFPEGGEMIEGVPGRVYFQVRTPQGKPADLKGIITDGTSTVAEVATLTDAEHAGVNRGHGVFTLTPRPGAKYFLKLKSPTSVTEPTKDGYPLPSAKVEGVALTALDAVTARGAPVRVRLQVGQGAKTLHVGAYASGRLISQQRIAVEAGKPVEVSLPGEAAAGGVTRVTVFEEVRGEGPGLSALIPRSERLVYRIPGEQLVLSANPDKASYAPGGKVRLELSAVDERSQPTPAVLLVGVVNRSVITMADNKTDRLMPTHFLLSGEVTHPAELEHADFLLTDHPKAGVALDLLLATQGWRRFAEQNGTALDLADKKEVDRMLIGHGQTASAPIELRKLEEQRVTAEFRARMEAAVIKTAEAESRRQSASTSLSDSLDAARRSYFSINTKHKSAQDELHEFEARFSKIPNMLIVALVSFLLFGGVLLVAINSLRSPKNETPANNQNKFIYRAVVFSLVGGLLAILAVAVINLGTNPTESFSYVGSNIKGDGALQEPAHRNRSAAAMPQAPPRPSAWTASVAEEKVVAKNEALTGINAQFVPPLAEPRPAPPDFKNVPPVPAAVPHMPVPPPAFQPAQPRPNLLPQRPQGGGRFGGGKPGPIAPAGQPENANLDPNAIAHGFMQKEQLIAQEKAKLALRKASGAKLADDVALSIIEPVQEFLQVPQFIAREYAHERDSSLRDVRSDFTETVYWHPVLVLPRTGKTTIEFQLSDDIARYQVLVAGHTIDGRIGAITTTIEARKPYSIDPKLPLEISHTDRIDVPIRVTNDSDVRRDVAVTLSSMGLASEGKLGETIALGPNEKGRRIFSLKANKLEGDASLFVVSSSNPGGDKDSIARKVRIVTDGFPGVGSYSDVIESRARGAITLPKDTVPGSLAVRLEVYPTTMSDLVKGLDSLLREPSGCFEQTSTSNYPNVMVLDYLNQTNQADPQAAQRAKQLIERGYAKLTAFECPDTPLKLKHGFEWFGAADMAHEALTAYGLLQFKDMARVHPVDPDLIKRTQEYLLSRKDKAGGFLQNKRALDHFGGAPKHTTDAYIVWALVESDPDDIEKLDLKKEIDALKTQAMNENSAAGKDAYFLALTANIMLLRGDRETAYRLLDRLQKKHLKAGAVTGAVTSITRSGGRDLEIETTALAVLGWLRANDPTYLPAVKEATRWISQQRGGYGGFGSTQSTILTLKALALFAKKSAHPAESGEFTVKVGGKVAGVRKFTEKDIEVIALNIENPEAFFKPGEKSEIEISTDAKQPYPFSLSYTCTKLTPESAEQCAVKIATKLARAEANEGDTVPLFVTLENRQKQGQGMAVAIVGLPAGLKVPTDLKQLTDLREKEQISFFEIRGRELILYWRGLAPEQKTELSIDLVCDVPGSYRGPASRGYLYYNADHKHWVEPLSIAIKSMEGK
jgi:hypothetical protein